MVKNEEDNFWEEGSFIQTTSSEEIEEKMKTFHKKHDEDINYNCGKCDKKISAHNKDWHNGMCDECFDKEHFPENKIVQELKSEGNCRICSKVFSQRGIKKHLLSCEEYQTCKGETKVYLIKAEAGPFWVYFEIEKNKKLKNLDRFLRDLWLECCGHLSAFTINNKQYSIDEEELHHDEESMNIQLSQILNLNLKFSYEYDFGTTTELNLECVSEKNGNKGINIIARNDPIDFKCEKCGESAKLVCVQCIWDGEGFVCKKCSTKHKCIEPYFLPIVNSPRIGMCGFTGEECKLIKA